MPIAFGLLSPWTSRQLAKVEMPLLLKHEFILVPAQVHLAISTSSRATFSSLCRAPNNFVSNTDASRPSAGHVHECHKSVSAERQTRRYFKRVGKVARLAVDPPS